MVGTHKVGHVTVRLFRQHDSGGVRIIVQHGVDVAQNDAVGRVRVALWRITPTGDKNRGPGNKKHHSNKADKDTLGSHLHRIMLAVRPPSRKPWRIGASVQVVAQHL